MKNKVCILASLILLASVATSPARAQTTNYQAYALFVYSIAKYSSWPSAGAEFKIQVLGNSKAYDEMQKGLAGKSIGGSIVKVEKIDNPAAKATDANIIYISDGKSSELQEMLSATTDMPVMIITEREGLHKKGAGISFVIIDNKLRFDINTESLEKRHVKLSTQISKLANEIL